MRQRVRDAVFCAVAMLVAWLLYMAGASGPVTVAHDDGVPWASATNTTSLYRLVTIE